VIINVTISCWYWCTSDYWYITIQSDQSSCYSYR